MIRVLSLGDSYTIGEGVSPEDRWPVQMVTVLRDHGILVDELVILAQTGWTIQELDIALSAWCASVGPSVRCDLVTLLIGVNNQYRGLPIADYRILFSSLLMQSIQLANNNPARVIVLSIPDWGVTPFAEGMNPNEIASQIDMYNDVNRIETNAVGAHYIDITTLSRQVKDHPEWVSVDHLHPSAVMYTAWIEKIIPIALKILSDTE